MRFFRVRLLLAFAGICPGLARAAADITVVVDLTPAGRKAVHPTPDQPAYYLPTLGAYRELGTAVAGEKPPSVHPLVHVVAEELAKQGYLVAIGRAPDLVIDLNWGYIDPVIDDGINYDQDRMNALVLGGTLRSVMPLESFNHQQYVDATMDDRYFVVVTAYDYPTWAKEHRKLVLWKAKMSMPKQGFFFDDVMASLVKAGGPSFGRETLSHPKLAPGIPDGKVEVGTPTVKSYGGSIPAAPGP